MKILHASDWHLGAYVGITCDDPYKRMENTMKCLDVLVETARQEQPDIILIPGDLTHNSKVWSDRGFTEVIVLAEYINTLAMIAPVAVLYGTPNHDGKNGFEALRGMIHSKNSAWFFTEPSINTIATKSGLIQIAGLPGFDKGYFRAQFPGLSAEDENRIFTDALVSIVSGLSAQVDSTVPSVLMAHHTVVGCELDNGTHVFQANEMVLPAAALDNSAFDLIALGHIHKKQQVAICNVPVYYSGSIDAFTFNDEGHDKGFYIHNMFGGYAQTHDFIKTPAREFLTEKWDESTIELYKEWQFTKIVDQYKNKVVRILYTCDSETEKSLDKKKLERDLYAAGAYYVSEIRPESITAAVNKEKLHEKLTVWDCLRRYLTEKKIENMADILMVAEGIVSTAEANSPTGSTSGLFLPIEIEVRNYRSYAEEKLSFRDIFFAMVNGRNGSGKSSLFMDAPVDCLYEKPREGELTGWIRAGEKSGSISFTFRLGDDTWRVTRTRQRSGKATLALAKLQGLSEGMKYNPDFPLNWEDISCQKLVDTQDKIVQLLGMDCDTFKSCVLIMQDQYGKFMEAQSEDRMAVLANLLGLGIYEQLEKLTKDRFTEVNREVRNIKAEIEKLEGDVKVEDDLYIEKAQVEASLAMSTEDMQAARAELTGYQAQLTAMDGYVKEAAELERELKAKTDNCTEKKSKKADLERRIVETESFLKNEQNILNRCAELDAARLEIAGLDGKVQLLNDKKAQYAKVQRELVTAKGQRSSIELRLQAIEKNLADRSRLEGLVNGNTVEAELEECERKAKLKAEYNDEAMRNQIKLNDVRNNCHRNIAETESSLDSLFKKAAMLKDADCISIENANCRFLKDAIEAKSKINNLEAELEVKKASANKDIEAASRAVEESIKKREAVGYDKFRHDDLIRDVKVYRDAKDKLAKLAADAATADALNKQDTELGERTLELESSLANMIFDIEKLELETGKVTELNSKVNSLLQYENMKMQLPKAKQFVESTAETVKQLESNSVELTAAIEKINDRLFELAALTSNKSAITFNKLAAEQQIKSIESIISTMNQHIGSIKAKLEVIAGQRQQLTVKQAELSTVAKQAAHLQVLAEAFSQDGIPHQIIRDIIPELEASANEILSQMTSGRMRLEFRTEKVLKSNKAKEVATLDIVIIDVDNGELPYLSRSGGQKTRCSLSVIFALAILKASRVGLQLGMLFIDEPAGLDEEGIEGYCAALETIHSMYANMRIVAISHDERMKARFAQQLCVDVTENGSKVRRL